MLRSKELSKMLWNLHENKLVDSHIRDYVSKWIVTLLMSETSSKATGFPIVKKKIRDEILSTPTEYVRRSSFYMVMKVLLQHSLILELKDEHLGKLLYKIIMLKFISDQCNSFNQQSVQLLNIELVSQALAKLARRIEKLSTTSDSLKELSDQIVSSACTVIKNTRAKIDKRIQEMQITDEKQSKIALLNNLNFEADIEQKVEKLRKYLKEQRYEPNEHSSNDMLKIKIYKRFRNERIDLGQFKRCSDGIQLNFVLSDFENQILYHSNLEQSDFRPDELRTTCSAYIDCAGPFHRHDPLGYSKMMLVLLKIVAMLDKIATKAHPMLLKHRSGIDPNAIGSLLLPHFIDLKIAHELETYFLKRNEAASCPSLIEETTISSDSFSAKFGAENKEIQTILSNIQKVDDQNIAKTQRALANGRLNVQCWRNEIAECSHQYVTKIHEEKQHVLSCELCSLMEEIGNEKILKKNVQELKNRAAKLSHQYKTVFHEREVHMKRLCKFCILNRKIKNEKIPVYRCLLPEATHEKNAIIFEWNVPAEVACLRDSLHSFYEYVTGRCGDYLNIRKNWTKVRSENPFMSSRNKENMALLSNTTDEDNFIPISSYKNISDNDIHLGITTSIEDVELHVDHDDWDFVQPCGYDCIYHSSGCKIITDMTENSIKSLCTLSVERHGKYKGLQWTVTGTSHTQNEVISRQSECSHELSLIEFKNFGSLRADGHRLQWRKLYAMIESEALSFENPSVLSLIMQTIWETGISGDAGVIRESHEDLQCIKFRRAMIRLLNKFVEQQKNNWAHPLKLLMVVLIAIRIFEVNDDEIFINEISMILDKVRTITIKWIDTNEKAIQAIKRSDQSNQNRLRKNLVFIAITGAATFHVHPNHKFFKRIFLKDKDSGFTAFRMWLKYIVTLKNNMVLGQKLKEPYVQMLLRLVLNIGIKIEPALQKSIKLNPNDLINFVKEMYSRSKNLNFTAFTILPSECNQILQIKVLLNRSHFDIVTIDLITGSFLVNNLPICRLSDQITQTDQFKRVFEDFVFEVQPDGKNSFSTIHAYNGSNSYGFSVTKKGVIIIERQSSGTEFELIPPEMLNDEIPPLLIENYSHWINKRDRQIEFRPKLFSDKNFSIEEKYKYQLDLKARRLLHKQTNRYMLDIKSTSYRAIVNRLSRLEQQKYIHIFMEEPKFVKIELVRMQLKFNVDCTKDQAAGYYLLSNEFSNMRVAINQKCGTLFGLKHGLILEEADTNISKSKLLLLPHGNVYTTLHDSHTAVKIDLKSDLHTPPCYSYKVDEFCRQLKPISGTYLSWFYLAYLHAVTSHGQIEPFTGMSGTERALQILQSNFVWSSSPYDHETKQMLREFEKLTPRRKLNEDLTMDIQWPPFIHPHSAQDSYVFIIKKLLDDSEQLNGLYCDKIKKPKPNIDTDLTFNARDYFQRLSLMPNLRISDEYFNKFDSYQNQKTTFPKIPSIKFSKNTQTVAILCNKREFCVPPDLSKNLKAFLISQNDLPGTTYIEEVENTLNNIEEVRNNPTLLRDRWISFYLVVRNSLLKPTKIAIILSLFAHHDNNINAILALQAISRNRNNFMHIDPPNVENIILDAGAYSEEKVRACLRESFKPLIHQERSNEIHNQTIKNDISKLIQIVDDAWPCEAVTLTDYPQYFHGIDIFNANKKLNSLLSKWYNHHLLDEFIDEVVNKLNSLSTSTMITCPDIDSNIQRMPAQSWSKDQIDWKSKISENLNNHAAVIEEAREVWNTSCTISEKSAREWWIIYETIMSHNSQHLIDAGIFPRLVPTLILPKLISNEIDKRMKMVIGAWAITIAREQRLERMSELWKIVKKNPHEKPLVDREIDETPYVNWKPNKYPEWLIFEIEQNLTIRRIQIEIAKRMIVDCSPDRKMKHFTMQLNMGEGKTAVVVPILASVLANGQQACQITVLKSLFATNLKSLRQYLGGMLGRKVYTFPCRRDLPVSKYVKQIHSMYKECQRNKGIFEIRRKYPLLPFNDANVFFSALLHRCYSHIARVSFKFST